MEAIEFFDRGVYLSPDAQCLVSEHAFWTYRDVQRMTNQIAGALVHEGLPAGAHIAVLSSNDPVAFICVLGTLRAHMVWVPLNARHAVEDIVDQVQSFDCDFLFFHSTYGEAAKEVLRRVGRLKGAVCIDAGAGDGQSLKGWMAEMPTEFAIMPASPHDVMILMATGGTTGRPKAVMQTHLAFETMIASRLVSRPSKVPPRFLAASPLTHGAGHTSFSIFAKGGTVFVLPSADALGILQAIEKSRITEITLPVTVVYSLLSHPAVRDYDYSSLEFFNYATAPMSEVKLKEALAIFGPVMTQGWGQSEALALTFLSREDHVAALGDSKNRRLQSCGRKLPFADVAVMDPEGRLLGANQVGELVARGNSIMKGYYNDPVANAEASRNGWHRTGDAGYYDDEGYFFIVDRLKDMIISGGFNVFPSEIERVIFSHPAVQNCAVIGVPDEKWGEKVTAVVQLKAGRAVGEAEIIDLCKARLGSIKAPKAVEFWAELPQTNVGKILKRQIRDRFWSSAARKV